MTTILAEVKHCVVARDGASNPFALLTPFYIASSNKWEAVTDVDTQFPNNGEVVWWNTPRNVKEGSVFKLKLAQVQVTDERHAAFRVDGDAQPFYVFVDMRGEPDAVEMRRKLATGGFTFTKKPVGPLLLQGAGAEWIGPLDMDFHQNQYQRWESGPASNSGFVTTRSVSADAIQEIVIQGVNVKCLRPEETLGGPVGKFSAQTDQQLIESLLKRLRKLDAKTADALAITKDVFHTYVRTLSDAKLIDELDEIEHVREEALQLLMVKLDADATWAEATASSLINHPQVSDSLDGAIQVEIETQAERIEAEARKAVSDLDERVSNTQAEMEELESAFSTKQIELALLENELTSKTDSLMSISDNAATQLAVIVDEVLADPVKELSKSALVRALVDRSSSGEPPTAVSQLDFEGTCFKTIEESRGALDISSRIHQQSFRSLQVCLSALLSGRPVVVVGTKSLELISAFCMVFAKDWSAKVNMPSDIFSVNDLFQLPVSPMINGGFEPIDLADYFSQANKLGVCFPLVLIGVNRAPMETALLDILLGPSNNHGTQLAVRRPGPPNSLTGIKVERSAFLMTTLVGGESVFRPHQEFLRSALFVDSDRASADPFPDETGVSLRVMAISASSINEWQDEGLEVSNTAIRTLEATRNWQEGAFGSLREVRTFCQVFGNEAVGISEWLLAKYGHALTKDELISIAQNCGGQVELSLGSVLDDAHIENFAAAGRDSDK